jgi:hypothetical protein
MALTTQGISRRREQQLRNKTVPPLHRPLNQIRNTPLHLPNDPEAVHPKDRKMHLHPRPLLLHHQAEEHAQRSSYVSQSPIIPTCSRSFRPVTVHRNTGSNARPSRSAAAKHCDFYVAVPSSPVKSGPTINWVQMKAEMRHRIQCHRQAKQAFKRMWWYSLSHPFPRNEETMDRPILASVITTLLPSLQVWPS